VTEDVKTLPLEAAEVLVASDTGAHMEAVAVVALGIVDGQTIAVAAVAVVASREMGAVNGMVVHVVGVVGNMDNTRSEYVDDHSHDASFGQVGPGYCMGQAW
jgi:hypothetical protein